MIITIPLERVMLRLFLATCSLAFIGLVDAQNEKGSLSGTISDPNGATVDEAPIQLRNKATGALARTTSKPDGRYMLAGLAPGAYEFSLVMPCCAYKGVTAGCPAGSRQNCAAGCSAGRDCQRCHPG